MGSELTEVFPKLPDELPGLILTFGEDEFLIVSKCEAEFVFEGETVNNYRNNKFWGLKLGTKLEDKILMCIDLRDYTGSPRRIKFFKS